MEREETITKRLSNKAVVRKANEIIRVENPVTEKDSLNALQQKLIMAAISLIHREKKEAVQNVRYEIKVKDFMALAGIERNSTYEDLRDETERLRGKGLKLVEQKEDGATEYLSVNWFQSIRYRPKHGTIVFKFSEDILPYLLEHSGYTWYYLKAGMALKGKHALALYEILRSWQRQGEVTYSIEPLKKMLGIEENEYTQYAQLKLRAIKPAVTEINAKVEDMYVKFSEIKEGRKVVKLNFEINSTKPGQAIEMNMFSNDEQEEPSITEFINWGVDPKLVESKVLENGSEFIAFVADYVREKIVKKNMDATAAEKYAAKALRNGWGVPQNEYDKEVAEKKKQRAAKRAAEKQIQEAEEQAAAAADATRQQAIDDYIMGLTQEQFAILLEQFIREASDILKKPFKTDEARHRGTRSYFSLCRFVDSIWVKKGENV